MYEYTFCVARDIPYLRSDPFGPNLARSAQSAWLCRAMQSALAARTDMPDRCAHPPAHMRTHLPCPRREATRARNRNPLCLRADIPDKLRPAPPPSRARRVRGRWPGRAQRACGKHTESSQGVEQIWRAQAKAEFKLRIWGQNAPFLSSMSSIESMEDATPRVVRFHRL